MSGSKTAYTSVVPSASGLPPREAAEGVDHLAGSPCSIAIAAQRAAQLAHHAAAAWAVSYHVADGDPELPVGELERVVPVAAEVRPAGARRYMAASATPGRSEQGLRQQASLE